MGWRTGARIAWSRVMAAICATGVDWLASSTSTQLDGATGVLVDGTNAYVGAFNADRITTVDVSNPASPGIIGSLTHTNLDGATYMVKNGDYLYVAARNGDRVTVVDVSTPSTPSMTGSVQSTQLDGIDGIVYDSGLVYATAQLSDRVTIVDVTTPGTPAIVGSLQDATNFDAPRDLIYYSGFVIVTSMTSGRLCSVDVSTPATPTLSDTILDTNHFQGAHGIIRDGTLAYVVNNRTNLVFNNYLTVVDISDPTDMSIVGSVNNFRLAPSASSRGMRMMKAGDYIFVACTPNVGTPGGRVNTFDVSNPAAPVLINSQFHADLNGAESLWTDGSFVYVASSNADRLSVFEVVCVPVCVPMGVTGWSQSTSQGSVGGIAYDAANQRAYLTSRVDDRISAIDTSSMTVMGDTVLGSLQDATNLNGARRLVYEAPYCYVACQDGDRVTIVDMTTPASPSVTGSVTNSTTLDQPRGIVKDGDYCYVSTWEGITIIDVSTPATPVIESSLVVGGSPTFLPQSGCDLVLVGTTLYVVYEGQGVGLYDVSDVSDPLYLGMYQDWGPDHAGTNSIAADGFGNLYVTFDLDDRVVSLDPVRPVPQLGSLSTAGSYVVSGMQLSSSRDYVYVTDANNDMVRVIDVSDPTSMSVAGSVTNGTTLVGAWGITYNGNYCYVMGSSNIFATVDVSSPSSPTVAATFSNAGLGTSTKVDIVYHNNHVFVATNSGGLYLAVVNVTTPTSPSFVTGFGGTSPLINSRYIAVDPVNDVLYMSGFSTALSLVVINAIDISTPGSPSLISTLSVAGGTGRMAYDTATDTLYVTVSQGGVHIIDCSNPASMSLIDTLGTEINAIDGDLGVKNSILYGGGATSVGRGQFMVDVSNPAAPVITMQVNGLATTGAMEYDSTDDVLYVGWFFDKFISIDVSIPTAAHFSEMILDEVTGLNEAATVRYDNDRIFVASFDESAPHIRHIDVSDPSDMTLVATTPYDELLEFAQDMVVAGTHLIAACDSFQIAAFIQIEC